LRQQLARRRCPIVGDRRYGSRIPLTSGTIALHASSLALDHPATGDRLVLEAPEPAGWRDRFPALFAARYR
ncbi:MAG: RNA pseudouridine synthase, partial [Planctomycetia bacterium]|nr:RNA pseudouridine synthase [Planctomycetia bacterium]